ncbi:hypothetical protein FRB99_006762, partial [Tulasnella sp. 403]
QEKSFRLLQTLKESKINRAAVHKVVIAIWGSYTLKYPPLEEELAYAAATFKFVRDVFCRLEGLSSVALCLTEVTNDILRHIVCSSPSLRRLSISRCRITGLDAQPGLPARVPHTENSTLPEDVSHILAKIPMIPSLRELNIDAKLLPHLTPQPGSKLSSAFRLEKLTTKLNHEMPETAQAAIGSLQQLLQHCPNLDELAISDCHHVKGVFEEALASPDRPNHNPQLTSFRGDPAIVPLFCRHAPLQELILELSNTRSIPRNLTSLCSIGSTTIRSLSLDGVDWTDDCIKEVARTCPLLEKLAIRSLTPVSLDSQFPEFSRMTTFSVVSEAIPAPKGESSQTTLDGATGNTDPKAQEQLRLITDMVAACGLLVEIRLDMDGYWKKLGIDGWTFVPWKLHSTSQLF